MTNVPEVIVMEIMPPASPAQQAELVVASAPEAVNATELQPVEDAKRVKRVMVIDDELAGLTYSHLPKDVQTVLADLTSPQVAELWEMAMEVKEFKALGESDLDDVRGYLASDAIIQEVILTERFDQKSSPELRQTMAAFLDRAKSVARLRAHLDAAFPETGYKVEYSAVKPAHASELLDYDLLIFDLVLQKTIGPVDEVVEYLKQLGDVAYPKPLPCIIIMSSRQDIITERMRFSHESNISAAGLLLLPKSEVAKENFGSAGLSLSYQQLDRQREIAQQMRVFMRAWANALDAARVESSKTMWNLDAAAMQELHHVAFNDHDPYDEYLNALLMREYLWHVEAVPAVGSAIEGLDQIFQAQFKEKNITPAIIKQRFIAPFVKPSNARELVSHFTWTGFPVPPSLADIEKEKALKEFAKLVPFGALLAPKELTSTTECLIHITQQCDLNQAGEKQATQSAQFTVVLPVEVQDYKIPAHDNDDLVARGLRINDKEYDFVLAKGRQLALPIPKFIDYARAENLSVVGRLRHDIATHFLLATANHMTRWASQKVNHAEVRNVDLYLYGTKFPRGSVSYSDNDGSKISVQIARSNKLWYFQDETSIHIALWVNTQLAAHYQITDLDMAKMCNQLSIGINHKGCLHKLIDLHVEGIKASDLKDRLSERKAPQERVYLTAVYSE